MSAAENLDAIDDASEADRRWFQRNPTRRTRVRPFVPGEMPIGFMSGDLVACVIVRQVQPGFRIRLPAQLPRQPKETEAEAERLLWRAMGKR